MKKTNLNPIGCYSVCDLFSVYVYDIQYGINDYVIAGWDDRTETRKRRIYTDKQGRAYFNIRSWKIFLDEVYRLQ